MSDIVLDEVPSSSIGSLNFHSAMGTAVPLNKFTQAEVYDFVLNRVPVNGLTKSLYRRVLSHPSIQTRYFSMNSLEDVLESDAGDVNRRYESNARTLAAQSLRSALMNNVCDPQRVDFLITTTCTGYICPGLSSHLIEEVGLKKTIQCFDLTGMGCGAAIPAIQLANTLVQQNSGKIAAVVCTEVCSAAFFSDDSADAVISNSIFSDGSAALILGHDDVIHCVDFQSLTETPWRETLRFQNRHGFLKNILGVHVPEQAAQLSKEAVQLLLRRNQLSMDDIAMWAIHPGGDKVLNEIQKELSLSDAQLKSSRTVLRDFGNMSSASVLFVLDHILQERIESAEKATSPVSRWAVLLAFGAGFSVHAALVQCQ